MDFDDLDFDLIKRHLFKAVIGGVMMGFLIMIILANTRPDLSKQSYDYWTQEARPFHINDQYQVGHDLVWGLELQNGENYSLDLLAIDVTGNDVVSHWGLTTPATFEAHSGKLMLVPIKQACQTNETFIYSLNITYSKAGAAPQIEAGKYLIYGRCL